MDIKLIECDKIEFPKVNGDLRNFSKEFGKNLAASIKAEGMHHAIAVRPNPEKEGFYLGVQGKHRHYAKHKVLKEQFIEANVFTDMDDQDAEMAMISENLWRNPLTKIQHIKSIKKWWEHFSAKHPEKVGRGTAGGEASKAKAEAKKETVADVVDAVEVKAESKDEPEDEKGTSNFSDMVAGATGQSKSAVKRDAQIAKAFDEEQLEVFEQMKVAKTDMLTVAKIKDEVKRSEVVTLIASGMEPQDAIKEVMKEAAPERNDGKSKQTKEAEKAAKAEKVSDMSDDDWFEKYCGEKAKLFSNPAQFKVDALLFRKLSDLRHAFRSKAKTSIKAVENEKILGPLFYLFRRFISISHPKDWMICDGCSGTGVGTETKTRCNKCSASGYLLKTENYV